MLIDEFGSRKFYGIYRGTITHNRDPLGKNRLRFKVPQVLGSEITDWAWGVTPLHATVTAHNPTETLTVANAIPAVGTGVFVMFEGGDPSYPVWIGTF